MSNVNFLGSYSGIDTNTVDQLIKAESIPLTRLENRKDSIVKEQNAWKDVNSRLKNLYDKAEALKDPKVFSGKKAVLSSEDHLFLSASDRAIEGNYKIEVKKLATSASLIGKKLDFEDVDKGFDKSGEFHIEGHETLTIKVNKEDSLKDIVNKINDLGKDFKDESGEKVKGTGVRANIIDNHIVLTNINTGEGEISLGGDKDLLENLGLAGKEVKSHKGSNAELVVNGIAVSRESNNISDVIDGVTIGLKKVHAEGQFDTGDLGIDYDKAEKVVKDFVDQYNSTMTFVEEKIRVGNPEVKGSGGDLARDAGLKRLYDSLRNMSTAKVSNDKNAIRTPSEIGLNTKDKSGKLEFDSEKFKKLLKEEPKKVMDFFYSEEDKAIDRDAGKSSRKSDYISNMMKQVDQFISTKNGIIKTKNQSYDSAIKDLNVRIDNMNDRLEKKREYYIKRFSTLDEVMMKAESQMTWLQNQVSSMFGNKGK